MDYLLSLLSLDRITALPIIVSGPGLLLIFLFLARAVRAVFSLRLITVFTSLVYAFVIALILSQAGEAIVQLLGIEETPQASLLQHPFDDGYQSLAQGPCIVCIKVNTING